MARDIFYFAYGTLQRGFPNHERFAAELGEPVGRFRTAAPYPLVVPHQAACTNPGCPYLHRMAALLPDEGEGVHVEGEVYVGEASTIERLDLLENYVGQDEAGSTHLRRSVRLTPLEGDGAPVEAHAYFVASTAPWRDLLDRGEAVLVARYGLELAEGRPKECCRRNPGHEGPHDVVALVSA